MRVAVDRVHHRCGADLLRVDLATILLNTDLLDDLVDFGSGYACQDREASGGSHARFVENLDSLSVLELRQ